MKKRRKKPKKEAGAGTPTIGNIEQTKSYYQTFRESNEILRDFLGLLLLRLVAGQSEPSGWQVFDQLLRQLYAGDAL